MITRDDLKQFRVDAIMEYQRWKAEIRMADSFSQGRWSVTWDNSTVEDGEPLIENIYSQAWEDKMAVAGTTFPALSVPPAMGTRADRAEANAAKRKRIYLSYLDRGRVVDDWPAWYGDWFHAGASYAMPWCNWRNGDGSAVSTAQNRWVTPIRFDPRQVYPMAHNSIRDMTACLVIRQRRLHDLVSEWGDLPQLKSAANSRKGVSEKAMLRHWFDEVYYFDGRQWACALAESALPVAARGVEMIHQRFDHAADSGMFIEWLIEPEMHGLEACPVVENKRLTTTGAYEGALMDVIPTLRVANGFMARLLDDLSINIYAPTVMSGIKNPEDWGPGQVLIAEPGGGVDLVRAPVNFEAQQTIASLIEQSRRQAMEPPQRAGDPGASIVSAKGVNASIGVFNSELALAQIRQAAGLQQVLSLSANFDEVWCYGQKQIRGMEGGAHWVENYSPEAAFNGDYRLFVTYGDATGMDEQQRLIRLATMQNMKAMSLRSFMLKSGIIEDVLQEERDITQEELTTMFLKEILPQTVMSGDIGALKRFNEKLDDDKLSVRQAVSQTIAEMEAPPAAPPGGGMPGGPMQPPGGAGGILDMFKGLAGGGAPGPPGPPPPGIDQGAMAEIMPGTGGPGT